MRIWKFFLVLHIPLVEMNIFIHYRLFFVGTIIFSRHIIFTHFNIFSALWWWWYKNKKEGEKVKERIGGEVIRIYIIRHLAYFSPLFLCCWCCYFVVVVVDKKCIFQNFHPKIFFLFFFENYHSISGNIKYIFRCIIF